MSHKLSIDAQKRGFFFSPSGLSEYDGTTIERPKPTMQEAIDQASALDPAPSATQIAVVSSVQGGSFSTGFVLSDFIQFNGENVSITTDAAIAITPASFLQCTLTSLVNLQTGSIGFNVDGEQSLGLECDFISVPENGIGVNISGTVDDLFFNLSQMVLGGEGGIGIDMTATMTTPIDMNMNAISLDADNVIFCQCEPVSATDTCVINVSSIKKDSLSSNTTGFNIKNGILIIESANIKADTALNLESGATCVVINGRTDGDINVPVGATLNGIFVDYAGGTITEDGIINGIIGNDSTKKVYYGSYRQKPFETVLLSGSSFSDQIPSGTDAALQLEFGAAQGSGSDPVEIDVNGNITINITDQYTFNFTMQYGRSGASGGVAFLFFRVLVNGVQVGNTAHAKLNNPGTVIPSQFDFTAPLTAADVVTTELLRGSAGINEGELISENPNLTGWTNSPSAAMRISRGRLVSEQ